MAVDYQGTLYADGGYADTLAVALALGWMQKQKPKRRLRIIVIDQFDEEGGTGCLYEGQKCIIPEYAWQYGGSSIVLESCSFTKAELCKDPAEKHCHGVQHGQMFFQHGRCTTVKNDIFGVQEGDSVDVIWIQTGANTPMTPSTFSRKKEKAEFTFAETYRQTAATLYTQLSKPLTNWLKGNTNPAQPDDRRLWWDEK